MKLKETFTYPGADVEAVYAMVADGDFRARCAEATGATGVEARAEAADGGHRVTIIREQPGDLPPSIKKFVGDTVKIKQTENWGGPDAEGNRRADVKMSVIGQPAEMLGTATLTSTGGDTEFTISGDVKVNVPFVGKKIEPTIHQAIVASVRSDVEQGIAAL